MTTSQSNQIFNVGDYVKTSKGNIGVIEKPSCIEIGFYTCNFKNWLCLEKFHSEQILESDFAIEKWSWSYPNVCIKKQSVPNQVKLGSKIYPIWSDKLIKLDKLTIRTQQGFSQHNITLPIADAKLLIDIYTRNNIWFAII